MSSWAQLDTYLRRLVRWIDGTAYILTDSSKAQLSPPEKQDELFIQGFEWAFQTLEATFGPSFPRKTVGKRHLHQEAGNCFVSEPLLSTYLLIVLLPPAQMPELFVRKLLDQANPILSDIIVGLPPLDGGSRALSQAHPRPR